MTRRVTVTAANAPLPLLVQALRHHLAREKSTFGALAGTELVISYLGGRLLDEPVMRQRITLTGDGPARDAAIAWPLVAVDAATAADLSERDRSVLLLACALAAGTPLTDLGGALRRVDGWHARAVLFAFYTALGGLERDPARAWLTFCANAHRADEVDVALLASMFTDRHQADRRRRPREDHVYAAITPVVAAAHLRSMLCEPWWSLRHGEDGQAPAVWLWEAAEDTRVEVCLTASGVLRVRLEAPSGRWDTAPNATDPQGPPERPLSLFDLATLHQHLRYVGIPVGAL